MYYIRATTQIYTIGGIGGKFGCPIQPKKYVGEPDPVKINPIFARGKQPLPPITRALLH
jgi:hypothetical protein